MTRTSVLLLRGAGNRNGSISIVAAITMTLMTICVGIAIDFLRAHRIRAEVQAALDAAVLMSVADTSGNRVENARKAVYANVATEATGTNLTVSVSESPDGTLVATGSGAVPTYFAGIFNVKTMAYTAASSAKPEVKNVLASVTMQTISAKGMLQKEIYLVTHDDLGAVTGRHLLLQYLLAFTPTKSVAASFNPPIGKTINLTGESYSNVSVEMVVYRNKIYDLSNKYVYSSTASNASSYLKTSGECWSSQGMTLYWEDNIDGDYRDFIGNFKCTLPSSSIENVRLSS